MQMSICMKIMILKVNLHFFSLLIVKLSIKSQSTLYCHLQMWIVLFEPSSLIFVWIEKCADSILTKIYSCFPPILEFAHYFLPSTKRLGWDQVHILWFCKLLTFKLASKSVYQFAKWVSECYSKAVGFLN